MKTKFFLSVLTAVLVTAFIIGCDAPPDISNLNSGQGVKSTPDGKVKVRLNIKDSTTKARTIMPDTSAYGSVGQLPFFLLLVTNNSNPGNDENLTGTDFESYFEISAFDEELTLTSGDTYTFEVFACDSDTAPINYLAYGSKANYTAGATIATSPPIEIVLKEITEEKNPVYKSNGKFSWNVDESLLYELVESNLELFYDDVILTLDPIAPGSNTLTEDLNTESSPGTLNNNIKTVDIPPGYYKMLLKLEKDGFQTVYVQEIVHIYSGFESKYEPKTLPALRSTRHIITLDYGTDQENAAIDRIPTTTIDHGNTYNDNAYIMATTKTIKHSNRDEYHFAGWLYNSASSTTTPMLPADRVLKPNKLYATWAPNPAPVTGDFSKDDMEQLSPPFHAPVIAPLNGTKSQGTITYHYEGTGDTNYPYGTNNFPGAYAEGTYAVTFDVAADPDRYKAVTGLVAGTLTLTAFKNPVAADYNFTNDVQKAGSVVAANIVVKAGGDRSSGAVNPLTILYEGINGTDYGPLTTVPQTPGRYKVTFEVAAVTGWNAKTLVAEKPLVVTKQFSVSLEWTDEETPTVVNKTATFAPGANNDGVLTIDIEVEDNHSNYEWYADFAPNTALPQGSGNYVLHLEKHEDNPADAAWFAGKKPNTNVYFTIMLEVSDLYSGEFVFESPY